MGDNDYSNPGFAANRWRDRLLELGIHPPRRGDHRCASLDEAVAALREREAELNCIYSFTQLMDRKQYGIEDFFARAVDILPPWWRYPEVACARIEMGDKTYKSLYYEAGPWELVSPIAFPGGIEGLLAIVYTEERPPADEGPFLKAERTLLDAVAGRLVHMVELKRTNARLDESRRLLEVERTSLREANAALRLILTRIEEEKIEAGREIRDNVDKILMPIIRELEGSATPEQKKYVTLLAEHLGHITSPFVRTLTQESESLTTTEVQICKLIRNGMGSKQIAELRGTSVATIHRHREHIRRKLGIANRKVNLASYLQRVV